ncbi:importin subunit alpha [Anaeramoeba flamelloides]|uniref:Importin subunit alpha n=1 Tax=Anaeramoeba flamelloides TaxID=1746091 RepID=A0AAV7YCX5_9EUKA|nr:importin subunit alpha [Anaeramoeba flamelloides]
MSKFQKKLKRRRDLFKHTTNYGESINKRKQFTIQLSQNKREQQLIKRRNLNNTNQTNTVSQEKQKEKKTPTIDELPTLLKGIQSQDIDEVKNNLTSLRIMVSEKDSPIDIIIEERTLQILIHFLYPQLDNYIRFQTAWILTNLCSGTTEQTLIVVELGFIPKLITLLDSEDANLIEQGLWCLGNIASDCIQFRNEILKNEFIIEKILQQFSKKYLTLNITKNAVWLLSQLFRRSPLPDVSLVEMALPTISSLLKSTNYSVISDACWTFNYISNEGSDYIDAILEFDAIPILVQLLRNTRTQIQTPSLLTISNIVSGNNQQAQSVLDEELLDNLKYLLNDQQNHIRKETLRILSNITAGTKSQIRAVIKSGYIKKIIDILKNDVWSIQKQALWVLSNAVCEGSTKQVNYILKCNSLQLFCFFLCRSEPKIIKICLDAIVKILQIGKDESEKNGSYINKYKLEMEEFQILKDLQRIAIHEVKSISKIANYLIDFYFTNEQEDIENFD